MKYLKVLITLFLCFHTPKLKANQCQFYFDHTNVRVQEYSNLHIKEQSKNSHILQNQKLNKTTSQKSNSKIPSLIYNSLENLKSKTSNLKGYSIILSIMLFSATTSSFINSQIESDYKFMTYFISQLSILGIVIIGAPIWEPMSSYFRNLAFKLNKERNQNEGSYLETLWHSTQQKLSINAQMSRNLISSALSQVQINLYHSQMAFEKGNIDYAISQIALMAYRMKTIYPDIHPNDPHIKAAFQSILTIQNFKEQEPHLETKILNQIKELDLDFNEDYYSNLIFNWFSI